MLKRVMSALVVSGVMLSGAAFAADQPATGGQMQNETSAPAVTKHQSVKEMKAKEHQKVEHKASKVEHKTKAEMKAGTTKAIPSEAAPASAATPASPATSDTPAK